MQSNLEFPRGPVTFTLVEGNGPVHLMGQHLPPDSSGELCDEEEEEFDDETDDLDKVDQDGGEILSSDEENAVAYDEDDDVQVAHATKRVHEVEDGSEDEDVS